MSSQGQGPNVPQGFPQSTAPPVNAKTGNWSASGWRLILSLWSRSGTAQGSGVVYTGIISAYASPTVPPGWALCDGSAVSRTVYAALFSVIGTAWGAGDGNSTFNLPNLTNRVLLGYGPQPFASRGGAIPVTTGVLGFAAIAWIVKT